MLTREEQRSIREFLRTYHRKPVRVLPSTGREWRFYLIFNQDDSAIYVRWMPKRTMPGWDERVKVKVESIMAYVQELTGEKPHGSLEPHSSG